MESRPALSDVLKRTQDLLTALKSQAQKGEKRDVTEQQTQSSPISLGRSVQWGNSPDQQQQQPQQQQHQVNTPTSGTPASTPARSIGQLQMVAPPELGGEVDAVMGKVAIDDFLEMKRNYLHYLADAAMGNNTPEALPLGPRMQASARAAKSAFDEPNDAELETTPDSYSVPDGEQRELEISHDITSLDRILHDLGRRPNRSKLLLETAPRQTYLELFQKWGIYQPQKHLTELQQYDHFIQLQHKKATLASKKANSNSSVPSISTRTPRRGSLRSGVSRRVSESSSTGTTSSWKHRSSISKELRQQYPHLIATAEGSSSRLGSISTANR
eukprot:TRINITY_DN28296_c0_g1_i1.p1 TRINITY_DN28296_c0_g1~~TRINITY_DN28296_c0_g1_i1.p1  ORF type:complete len:329 (+),score=54.11 TRINITY_DN28296_c0_g1_i1:43-1029(+)